MKKWTSSDSARLYNTEGWGKDYFSINENGNVAVTLPDANIDIHELVTELSARDINTPILLRFPEIFESRVNKISSAFAGASKEYGYKSESYCVYPIKVNQMKPVVEEIAKLGKKYNIGLEAGSKPELHAVLALAEDDAPIVCNGYKDEDYIELALLAQKMGRNIYLVVEKLNEVHQIISIAKKYSIRPNIGVRVKLSSSGSGKWEDSAGDKSKFGLGAADLLEFVDIIKNADLLDSVKLIHFHIGSQITKIRSIKNALREAANYYYQLRNLGCEIEYFDAGGGLGVDYDGTNSSNISSINYDISEYANDVVFAVTNISDKYNLPHPKIITESGRALTAHHSVLVFDVLEKMSVPTISDDFVLDGNSHENILELYNIYKKIDKINLYESWHDAAQIREENNTLFSIANMDLTTRAEAERLYWSVAQKFYDLGHTDDPDSEEFSEVSQQLADKYFCNFSLFQSLPDSWAIGHLFPIMPIHRLNEKPNRRATIQDITCDSDGKVNYYVGENGMRRTLPVHNFKQNEKYYLAIFLVGAYQEILGDMHNLFGDTNTVHIKSTNNSFEIQNVIDGESVDEVLNYVGFSAKNLVKKMESQVNQAIKSNKITKDEGREYLAIYGSGLYGYTYLE
jgi:arginine decarboxylase